MVIVMGIYQLIDSLLMYGKKCELIVEEDYYYTLNGILSVLHLNEYEEVKEHIELTLDEIAELFAVKENPDTSDPLTITITLGLFGLFMFIISSKKLILQK